MVEQTGCKDKHISPIRDDLASDAGLLPHRQNEICLKSLCAPRMRTMSSGLSYRSSWTAA